MTWLLPTADAIPTGGTVRSIVTEGEKRDLRAYNRAYYHAKRKGKRVVVLTPEQRARRSAQQKARYHANPEHHRAIARANYWRHRDEYLAKARERARKSSLRY